MNKQLMKLKVALNFARLKKTNWNIAMEITVALYICQISSQ